MHVSCFPGSMMKLLLGIFLLTFIHSISPSLAITNITTDQSALLALKAHITDDPQKILASNWSTTTSVCNWVGVTCGLLHQRVAVLDFSSFGLTGTIPPHLGNLSFLTELRFGENNFHGSLPIELTHLRRLKFIDFVSNKFVGEIPLLFGTFSKLQVLALYGNQFSGSIPASIFNSSTYLEIIDLGKNLLSGIIPSVIFNMTSLEELFLDNNTLTGTIPSVIFNMSHLKILSLGDNNFDSGDLPDKICQNLPNLEFLYMASSNLVGRIPSQLSQCGKLRHLALSFNNFIGSIPQTIGNMTSLEELYFGNNNLTGSIPEEIGNATMLNIFSVYENKLTGIIPSVIFNMSHLKRLSLGDNNFDSGDLPDNICQNLPNLELLYMGKSNLGGRIPSQLSQCGKLRFLTLSFNNLVGSIPPTVGNMTSLEELFLDNNTLTEYGLEGVVSTSGDMYSYGIILMETFTGKKPVDEMFVGELSLKKWVEDAFIHYDIMDVVDTILLEGENVLVVKECVSSVFKLALCCATELPIKRKNMKEISAELNKVKSKYLLQI